MRLYYAIVLRFFRMMFPCGFPLRWYWLSVLWPLFVFAQNDPALQASLDWSHDSGFYLGTWASNVDFGANDPKTEIDFYAGVKPTVGDTSLDFGVLYYGYSKDKGLTPGSYSYVELKAAASRAP